MRAVKAATLPWWQMQSSGGWNVPNLGALVVGFAALIVSALSRDVPRWAFLVPLGALALVVVAAFGPWAWRFAQVQRLAKRQRGYLKANWSRYHDLVAEFASFFASNTIWNPYALSVKHHAMAPEFSAHMSFLNTLTANVDRATQVKPRTIHEARLLSGCFESAVSYFEGRGSAAQLRNLRLDQQDAENREKFFAAYNRFKGRCEDFVKEANMALGDRVFSKPDA